jgi:hypothetical protein
MKSHDRQAFCPTMASAIGADYLESRQLLSALAAAGDVAEVDQVRAIAGPAVAPRAEDASLGSAATSGTQTGTAADLGGAGDTGAAQIQGTSDAASIPPESAGSQAKATADAAPGPAETPSENSSTEVSGSGAGPVVPQSSAKAAVPNAAAAQQTSVVDATPSDEGGTLRTVEAPAPEEWGGGGVQVIAGVTSTGPAAESIGSGALSSSPVGATSPSVAAIVATPRSGPPSDAASSVEPVTDGGLLMNVGGSIPRTAMSIDPSAVHRILAIVEKAEAAAVDGDVIDMRAPQEATPSPRSADLLTDFLPFDRASLEDAIDRFLAPLEDLGVELANWRPSTGLIQAAAFVATATVATEVVRRRLRGGEAAEEDADGAFARYPDHPWAWSLGES